MLINNQLNTLADQVLPKSNQKAKTNANPTTVGEAANITISKEAQKLLDQEEKANKMMGYYKELREGLINADKAAEGAHEPFDDMLKCIKISMRIVNGDIVPMQDEKFLAEKNPKLYSMSMNMRRIKIDPEEFESILDEEKSGTLDGSGESDNPTGAMTLDGGSSESSDTSIDIQSSQVSETT